LKSDNSQTYRVAPQRRIVLKIVLLFLLLITSVIATAAYSTLLERRRANHLFSQELLRKIEIAGSVQNGQIEKLRIISGIVKEQNQRYCDFLDYDNLSALTFMLKSIATIHDIDLAFVFDENGDLATTYPKGPHVKNPSIYGSLISNRRARTDVEQISAAVLIDQFPDFIFRSKGDQILCFKSVIPLLHDTGEIYGYVVLIELINNNKRLADRMADLSKAEIVYYDLCGKVILTSFTASKIPYPIKGIIKLKGGNYRSRGANLTNSKGEAVGRLIVAVDNKPFLEKRRYLLLRNLIPFFSTVIICFALFFLLKIRVFDKIRQLITTLRGVSEGAGDLSIRLQISPKKVASKDLDEVEQMGIDFNHMMAKLEEAYDQLAEARKEAETASISKSQFLANMSHEIRTPMNAVIGFSDMLIDTDLDEDQTDYAKTIKRSGDALLSLINDILDFSKIEAGELQFEEIDFDPELIAYDVCDLIRPKIGLKPIEVLCRVGDNVPSIVRGDPTRFRQVLTNLMGNAPKFTESGEIELSLYVEEERDEEVKLHATIRDTGIGIDRDKLAHIFDPFQQADGSTTRKYGGTGLGLSICKKISHLMNGDVWAESPSDGNLKLVEDPVFRGETGNLELESSNNQQSSIINHQSKVGSIFHFTAWLGKAGEKEPGKFTSVSLSGKKVLIVDDNRTNLEILDHLLVSVGMGVLALTRGEEVLPAIQRSIETGDRFHLSILDIQMPGMSGYDIAKQIRDWEGESRDDKGSKTRLPLVALSSLMARDARKCEEAGFDGFLSKPVRRENLYLMLEGALGKKVESTKTTELKSRKIMTQYSLREERKHSVRILLAEDNPVNQKLAKIMLTKAGYQVEIANNGKEAVDKLTGSPEDFDLIFMDIQMPEMDGLEASELIREKGLATIPIVAMTAHAMKGDRERCLEAGMNDYITKPIKREIVFEVLERWVLRKEAL